MRPEWRPEASRGCREPQRFGAQHRLGSRERSVWNCLEGAARGMQLAEGTLPWPSAESQEGRSRRQRLLLRGRRIRFLPFALSQRAPPTQLHPSQFPEQRQERMPQ